MVNMKFEVKNTLDLVRGLVPERRGLQHILRSAWTDRGRGDPQPRPCPPRTQTHARARKEKTLTRRGGNSGHGDLIKRDYDDVPHAEVLHADTEELFGLIGVDEDAVNLRQPENLADLRRKVAVEKALLLVHLVAHRLLPDLR